MKKFKIFLTLVAVFTVLFLNNLSGMGPSPGYRGHHRHNNRGDVHHDQRPVDHDQRPGSVGVPLDGGLLALLGAAGIAYFVARKKKSR